MFKQLTRAIKGNDGTEAESSPSLLARDKTPTESKSLNLLHNNNIFALILAATFFLT